jgi:hypothetical protein
LAELNKQATLDLQKPIDDAATQHEVGRIGRLVSARRQPVDVLRRQTSVDLVIYPFS